MIQGVWVRKTMELQVKNIAIQEKEDSLNIKEFSEQCHVALRNVLEQINIEDSDSSDLYGAVKQIRSNRFKVDINDELQPYYLETLLKKAFYAQNINQNFAIFFLILIFLSILSLAIWMRCPHLRECC